MPGDTTPRRFARRATDTRLALPSRPSPVPCVKPRQISDKLRFRALDSDGGTVRASGTIPRHPIPGWFRFSPTELHVCRYTSGRTLRINSSRACVKPSSNRVRRPLFSGCRLAIMEAIPLAPERPTTMSDSDDGAEPSSHELVNSFVILRISCEKRVTASVCSGWLSEKSSAKSTEDKRQRRMSQNNGPSTVDFITPSLRTIPRHSIPRYCRAIKRCSCVRCNLAVIGTIWPVIDVTATGAVQPLVVVPPPNTFEAIDFMTDSSKPSL